MRLPHRPAATTAEQAMTPMIDVVFLLLIFFVVASASQTREDLLPAELAAGGVAADLPATPRPLGELWIRLQTSGDRTVAVLNGTQHPDLAALETVLAGLRTAGAAAEMPAVIDAAQTVPVGDVVRVYDAALDAGFDGVFFATGSRTL